MIHRLTLICQGATAATRRATFAGDEPLEETARERATGLSVSLGQVDKAWRSPARAAGETASALGLAAEPVGMLRDLDMGRWRGLALSSVAEAEPAGLAAWIGDPDAAPHGGETVAALLARVSDWLDSLRGETGRTAAIAGSAVIRAAVASALGAPGQAFWRIDVEPLGVAELSCDGKRWVLKSLGAAPRGRPRAVRIT